ncbi:ribonuclease P protein component [Comamonas sp. NLF-1-9]|uniref:ribonuclease P protein component n=1 Tax=Comamonas sp. NLF-1-9 TaxID=2853163 RepID=UPI001C4408AA|nr:ribonuclease P protein component [Comamonas sp. NLF-1-9]QXL83956.1 ribonuclease P protein component [Comamonas sp. NLF-1-9]
MHRLKTRPQFQAVLAAAVVARTAHFALHALGLEAGHPLFAGAGCHLGALVPKRWARRAVTRNLVRRQIYAMGAQAAPQLACAAYVVRLRTAFDRRKFPSAASPALKQAVRRELAQLLERAPRAPLQP